MITNEVKEFNKRLSDKYGRDVSLDLPYYRIAWTSEETEVRKGTYSDFNESGTYLRTVTEVRRTEKYPLFSNKFVLETLQMNEGNPELIAKYSYEPIHIFGANGSYNRPVWDKVEIFVEAHKFVMRRIKSPSDMQSEEDERFFKEKIAHKEILKDAGNAMHGAFKAGEAVVVRTDNLKPLV